LELRRSWDDGWRIDRRALHVVGDGLFNLYYVGGSRQGNFIVEFSTSRSEKVGLLISASWTLLVLLAWVLAKRRRGRADAVDYLESTNSTWLGEAGRYLGTAGLLVLAAVALVGLVTWWGAPSRVPWLMSWILPLTGSDLYGRSDQYVAEVVLLLSIATLCRLIDIGLSGRKARES
jgi:hypothetical protein